MRVFFQRLLSFSIYFFLSIVVIFWLTLLATSHNTSLTGFLHRKLSWWPVENTLSAKTTLLTVKKADFGDYKSQTVQVKVMSPKLTIADSSLSNPVTVKADYFRLFDEPTLTSQVTPEGVLSILVDRQRNLVDLPPQPYPEAKEEIKIGNLIFPTSMSIKTLSGPVEINFSKEALKDLTVETQSSKVNLNFTAEGLPRKSITLQSEDGDFTLNLPNSNYHLHYILGKEAKLVLGREEIRSGEGERGDSSPDVLQIVVRVEEGDVEIIQSLK